MPYNYLFTEPDFIYFIILIVFIVFVYFFAKEKSPPKETSRKESKISLENNEVSSIPETTKKDVFSKGSLELSDRVYKGEIKNELPHGTGKVSFKNGDYYDGQLVHGKFEGEGIMVKKEKGKLFRYNCRWRNNLQNGYGTCKITWKDYSGDRLETYEGNFENGKYHGKGKLKNADGNIYEGDFKNGLEHGYGVEISDGVKNYGRYKDGICIEKIEDK